MNFKVCYDFFVEKIIHTWKNNCLALTLAYLSVEKLADNKKRTVFIGLVTLEEDTTIQTRMFELVSVLLLQQSRNNLYYSNFQLKRK